MHSSVQCKREREGEINVDVEYFDFSGFFSNIIFGLPDFLKNLIILLLNFFLQMACHLISKNIIKIQEVKETKQVECCFERFWAFKDRQPGVVCESGQ